VSDVSPRMEEITGSVEVVVPSIGVFGQLPRRDQSHEDYTRSFLTHDVPPERSRRPSSPVRVRRTDLVLLVVVSLLMCASPYGCGCIKVAVYI
jgi:hypothetical protein